MDAITDTLYWTDSVNRTINYISLKDSDVPHVLLEFKDENPQDVVVDSCRR